MVGITKNKDSFKVARVNIEIKLIGVQRPNLKNLSRGINLSRGSNSLNTDTELIILIIHVEKF